MVFRFADREKLRKQGAIDPHFFDGKEASPIARFIPTTEGWEMARAFCRAWRGQ